MRFASGFAAAVAAAVGLLRRVCCGGFAVAGLLRWVCCCGGDCGSLLATHVD
ncbi:hypothetical protein [Gardnerella sp. Marseille-Q2328]|uniref:hypothetical protein n=1 Tax=Gardnerella sp. Marseille-Q2328 TaxID=2759694 RepID=UPI00202496C0|nr:hypothetical protein [Gardnerella sp. Marseille-Q2328]